MVFVPILLWQSPAGAWADNLGIKDRFRSLNLLAENTFFYKCLFYMNKITLFPLLLLFPSCLISLGPCIYKPCSCFLVDFFFVSSKLSNFSCVCLAGVMDKMNLKLLGKPDRCQSFSEDVKLFGSEFCARSSPTRTGHWIIVHKTDFLKTKINHFKPF